jgi:hypothetical protein
MYNSHPMTAGVKKRLLLLVFLLTVFDYELLRGQHTDSLEQRLYQQFDYDDPKGTETRLTSLAREAESTGNTNALA